MARRELDRRGRVRLVELDRAEMARLIGTSEERLASWQDLIPAESSDEGLPVYRFRTQDELALARKRGAVLATRMSVDAVKNIEALGRLDAYAALAADCPPGLTVHVYRSFLVIVLMQRTHGVMLDAQGLAERAELMEVGADGEPAPSVKIARAHLRLLQALGLLEHAGERWEFSRIPAAARQ